MKKLITMMAVVAVAGAVSAQVVSDNIVGYSNQSAPAGGMFSVVGITQFTTDFDIQNVIANKEDLDGAPAGSNYAGAHKLYIWNATGTGYDTYALFDDGAGTVYWASIFESGWQPPLAFLGVNPAVVTVPRTKAAWLETAPGGSSPTVTVLGEAPADATFDVTLPASGFDLISYPFTATVNVNQLVVGNAAGSPAGSNYANSDLLYVWNDAGTGYDTFALYDDGAGTVYWASIFESGWQPPLAFLGVNPADYDINLGEGFWFQSNTGAKTITFSTIY